MDPTTPTVPKEPADTAPADAADWRTRAIAAEQELDQLSAKLTEVESSLTQTRDSLSAAERRAELDRAVFAAEPIDPEAVRLLAESALNAKRHPDATSAIADIRRHRPFLFRATPRRPSATGGQAAPPDPLSDAATAARSGDRRALIDYLRLRRTA